MEDYHDQTLLSDCRVTLTARSGSTFTGFVHSIQETSGKIVLKNVTTAGSKLYGPQIFDRSDLINLEYLSCAEDANDQNRLVTDNKGVRNTNSDDTVTENTFRVDDERIDNEADCDDYYLRDDHVLICDFSDKFYDAIVYIMDQKVVGVAFKGVNIGRDGTLSLIQVATKAGIFVFDILRLQKRAFDEGLQALFQASSIVKVIHDCRWISDMLREKYNIVLANIFDTQVANAFVHKILHNGNWPHYVESLPHCLVKHLNLPVWTVSSNVKGDPSVWLQRPLSANLLSEESRNVSHLIELYQVLMNKLLYEFKVGVEIYLSYVRTLNGQTQSNRANGCPLPNMFLEIPKLVNNHFADSRQDHAPKNCAEEYHNRSFHVSDQTILCDDKFLGHRSKGSRSNMPKENKRSSHSNDYRNDNIDRNIRVGARDNNMKVCEDRNLKYDKNLQEGMLGRNQGSTSGNTSGSHLSRGSWLSPRRKTNSSSPLVAQNGRPDFNEDENVLKNKRIAQLHVSGRTNCTVELERIDPCSDKRLATHKVTRAEKSEVEDILACEMKILSTVKHVADSTISRSKLWQAVHAKQSPAFPDVTFELNASEKNSNQLGNRVRSSHELGAMQKHVCDNMKTAGEAFQKPGDVCISNSEKSLNSSLEGSELNTSAVAPSLLDSPPSLTEAVTYNCLNSHAENHVPRDALRGTKWDFSSFVPAGFMPEKISKKRIQTLQKRMTSRGNKDFSETLVPATLPAEDDFGCIPMQGSLSMKRLHEVPLGATVGIGDLFSESECSLQQQGNPEPHPALSNESSVEDTDIENTYQLQVLLKALKMSPLSISGGLLHKLLPPKIAASCSKQQL